MIIALIALAAAAPAPIYDAWGTEPFWGLTITRKTMVVDDQSAERKISAPTPQPKVTRLGMSATSVFSPSSKFSTGLEICRSTGCGVS